MERTIKGYWAEHFLGILGAGSYWLASRRSDRSRRGVSTHSEQARTIHEALTRDGIAVVPGFASESEVASLRWALPERAHFTVSPEGDRALMFMDADSVLGLRRFFQSDVVVDVAKAYIGADAIQFRRTIGIKDQIGEFVTFETNYHMDTWRPRLKVFLFLEDVGVENAPMQYLVGSHRGAWRSWTEARIKRYYRRGPDGFADKDPAYWFLGSFWPHEIEQLKNDFGYTELSCIGTAGTAVFFDGRGLHRATPLRSGRRVILTSYWIREGRHV